jgi:hypothetical protein
MEDNMEELRAIIGKFAASGWNVIAVPAKNWLAGTGSAAELIAAVERADAECGSCGCEYDPLYKRVLALKDLLCA